MKTFRAIYEDGVFRPLEPVEVRDLATVRIELHELETRQYQDVDPSAEVRRIDADKRDDQAEEPDRPLPSVSKQKPSGYDLREVLREQQHKKGLSAIFGKWPGTETDEEIAQALKGLEG